MMQRVRTTVDLPLALRRRVEQLAAERGQSLSATLAELAARGVSQLGDPLAVATDEVSGLPVVSLGRRLTSEDVAATLDEE